MNVMAKMRAAAIAGLGFALGLGGVLSAAPGQDQAASAGVKVPKLEFRDVKLENGLRVILVPDHSAPVCGIDVCNTAVDLQRTARAHGVRTLIRAHDV